jgi:hypothetical protein
MRYAILTCVLAVLSSGCHVKGFRTVPDGLSSPVQLRSAAAVARAEAQALDAVAAEQQGMIDNTVQMVRDTVTQVVPQAGGLPDALWGLLGLGAGWMVPTPGQKRRERVAASEGRLGNVVLAKDQNGGQGRTETST